MLTALWSGLGGKAAERWASLLASPALVFWLGGVLAWVAARGGFTGPDSGWKALERMWVASAVGATATAQVLTVVLVLLVVAGSARLAEMLTLGVLRLLEGYWPRLATPLWVLLVALRGVVIRRRTGRWRELARRREDLTAVEHARFAALNAWRAGVPAVPRDRMPTRLGDLLRAAESRPRLRYGLDAVVCWPHLWLVLPEQARVEVAAARARLDEAVRWWLWSALFAVWAVFTWWALVVAVIGMTAGHRLALAAAGDYGRLVQASFDLYRRNLYIESGWEPPVDPRREHRAGEELTTFLERGPGAQT